MTRLNSSSSTGKRFSYTGYFTLTLLMLCLVCIFPYSRASPTADNNLPVQWNDKQNQTKNEAKSTCPTKPLAVSEVDKENAANAERYAYYKMHKKEYFVAAIAPTSLSNWILAGLGIVGGVVAIATLFTIKQQTNLTINRERARLSIEANQPLAIDDGPEWTESLKAVFAGSGIQISNFGATIAFNVQCRGKIVLKPAVETIYPRDIDDFMVVPTTIIKHEESISVEACTLLKAGHHRTSVINGSKVAYFTGVVKYEDIFGKRRSTRFSYRWKVSKDDFGKGLVDTSGWVKTKRGNYAT